MRWRAVLACAVLLAGPACGRDAPSPPVTGDDTITVASFNFTESQIVAEIYVQALRAGGFEVRHLARIGTRELVLPALERGLVEVVPEYAGSAVAFLGGEPTADPARTHATLAGLLAPRGIQPLRASSAQDQNALVVSLQTARALSLRSVSDLIQYAPGMVLGGPPECPVRPLCLAGLEEVYSLRFEGFQPLEGGGALTAAAVEQGTVDVGVMFTTDGALRGPSLVALEDDRGLQPAENLTPLVRRDTVARFGPRLTARLDLISTALTTRDLRELNAAADAGAEPAAVAVSWLAAQGLGEGGLRTGAGPGAG